MFPVSYKALVAKYLFASFALTANRKRLSLLWSKVPQALHKYCPKSNVSKKIDKLLYHPYDIASKTWTFSWFSGCYDHLRLWYRYEIKRSAEHVETIMTNFMTREWVREREKAPRTKYNVASNVDRHWHQFQSRNTLLIYRSDSFMLRTNCYHMRFIADHNRSPINSLQFIVIGMIWVMSI